MGLVGGSVRAPLLLPSSWWWCSRRPLRVLPYAWALASSVAAFTRGRDAHKALARLQRLGLLANTGQGQSRGEPNAWTLTDLGEKVAQGLNLDNDMEDAR